MLTQFGGFPAFEIQYDMGGHLVDPAAEAEALAYFGTGDGKTITDVFVISHGWNNDIADARVLYHAFFEAMQSVQHLVALPNRTFGVLALFWPSKKFADSALIPGGAAGVISGADLQLSAQLDQLAQLFASDPDVAAKIAHARSLIPLLDQSATAQDDYVATIVSMVPKPRYERDEGLDDARAALDTTPGRTVLERLTTQNAPATAAPTPGTGGAASFGAPSPGASAPSAGMSAPSAGTGSAAGFGNVLGGIKAAAANFGDLVTYYTMKDRAGIVGRTGAAATIRGLRALRGASAPSVHLIGHSFGGRLVTAAANALSGTGTEVVQSMSLLEAAYSHNGVGKNWDGAGNDGAFRSVVANKKVRGPILITHSAHDFPVGVAYPTASRLMNQVAAGLFGGPDDKYGGMGRNGAQHTPESIDSTLLPAAAGTTYTPQLTAQKWIRNLNGDGPPPAPTITGHSDVAKPEIAYALLTHIAQPSPI